MKKIITFILLVSFASSCSKEPDITDNMLDGNIIYDPSLYAPEEYLVSYANPNPTTLEAKTPVVIAIHGYSASTFEWDEFRSWAKGRDDFFISQVLMGGHGRNYEAFKEASWKDWKAPLMEEYQRLLTAGYTDISLLGSSTGAILILKLLEEGFFNGKIAPQHIFLVDPNVISSNKTLSMINVLGPMMVYLEVDNNAEEDKYWYHYRPFETLQELRNITDLVRKSLQKGITMPAGTSLKVYKSEKDAVADPVSAVLIHKGLKTFTGNPPEVEMIPSELHVYTRLGLRTDVSSTDFQNQQKTFEDIAGKLIK
ncbi:MAG: esterase [Bacteroidetes bacterium]|nr:esterase [Bacteroidota bacterium]